MKGAVRRGRDVTIRPSDAGRLSGTAVSGLLPYELDLVPVVGHVDAVRSELLVHELPDLARIDDAVVVVVDPHGQPERDARTAEVMEPRGRPRHPSVRDHMGVPAGRIHQAPLAQLHVGAVGHGDIEEHLVHGSLRVTFLIALDETVSFGIVTIWSPLQLRNSVNMILTLSTT